ncbi:MAG: hypothetical protein ABSF50_12935 [Burkholderiaceae bacterium]|jgi:hypothetical protein
MRIALTLLVAGCVSAGVEAHVPSSRECLEAGDFIKNAALGRDNGLTRNAYMEHLLSDLQLIRAFPVESRWFVQDDEDAVLLVRAAQNVFDDPRSPSEHQSAFLNQCRALSVPDGASPRSGP